MAKLILLLVGMLVAGTAQADQLSGADLLTALQHGGYVIVMRHASSPSAPPTAATAEPDNTALERQLDATGRRSAEAMGRAIKASQIPIGVVWCSPTYRAVQTVRLAGLPAPTVAVELGDAGHSMQAINREQSDWLLHRLAERPHAGSNTLIVTQYPNIQGALGQMAADMSEGEALVVRPGDTGADAVVGRMRIDQWPALSAQR